MSHIRIFRAYHGLSGYDAGILPRSYPEHFTFRAPVPTKSEPYPKGFTGGARIYEVATSINIREMATSHGRMKKRINALTAVICGIIPAALLSFYSSSSWLRWVSGLIIGLIWGNAFEYVYHRWLLHRQATPGSAHHQHHAKIGTPDEAEYVALITSPLNIVLLFVINGIPAYLISVLFGLQAVLSGILIGWTAYLVLCEEFHWRIHMNGWLPPGLEFARAYHMSHHDIPTSRYNVFLPLFDLLFRSSIQPQSKLRI